MQEIFEHSFVCAFLYFPRANRWSRGWLEKSCVYLFCECYQGRKLCPRHMPYVCLPRQRIAKEILAPQCRWLQRRCVALYRRIYRTIDGHSHVTIVITLNYRRRTRCCASKVIASVICSLKITCTKAFIDCASRQISSHKATCGERGVMSKITSGTLSIVTIPM